MAVLGLVLLYALGNLHGSFAGVQVNPVTGYDRWPNNIIPVRTTGITNAYPEYPVLQNAMNQISLDLGYCVNFTIYNQNVNAGQPNLVLQNRYTGSTTTANICTTFPGYTAAGGVNGQVAIMFGSQTGPTIGGCLDNQRDAMRILVNAMGLRSEFLRDDRAAYMTFPTLVDRNSLVSTTLQQYNIFADTNRYNTSVAITRTPFDYNSITMITGSRYAGTSTPVFTIPSGTQVGQLARLSLQDCNTLKIMYGCPPSGYGPTPQCVDPYASTSGISLTPNPTVLQRTIQCASSSATVTTTGNAYQVGAFVVNGLQCDPNSNAQPTITPTVTGLGARLTKYANPIAIQASTGLLATYAGGAGTTCQYVLEFTYQGLPLSGQINQQITVNIQSTQNGVSTTVAGLPVTLNLNCAPQFTTVSVFQYGPAAQLASTLTRTLGGTAPNNNIQVVQNNNPNPTSSPSYSNAPNLFTPYIVQYNAIFGQRGALNAAAVTPLVNKVFVNCGFATGGNIGDGGAAQLAGTNVIGQVQATDPEGGNIEYYVWSERFGGAAATPGERFAITSDGILVLSALAPSPNIPTAAVDGQIPLDTSSSTLGGLNANTGATTAPAAAAANDINAYRNAIITAVDSTGGKSTIQISLYLACGTTQ
ncbi:uncharacterized protein LOC129596002 [Paramacrobiotus metropolitanus]|uniref:uncharacterized protein LOC129596002 n=1 Tax=Paramacrobiotus metropolitanus TaxID=2943436 RepID=UPI002445A236|nr:uncharacterized protein LOC129596002 [Paramacrobiotus metropolitanus]